MEKFMKITHQDVTLRNWTLEDASRLATIGNHKSIFDNLTDGFPSPYTLEDAKKYIAKAQAQDKNLMLAICFQDIIVGSIAAIFQSDIYRKNVVIAYFIAEDYWRKGIATQAIQMITEYVFQNYDIMRISAEPFEKNIGSRKALEKAGFQLEGILRSNVFKNGEILNSCMYSKLRVV